MPALLLSIFRFVRLLLSGHQALAIENAALRLQLAAFQRKRKRPVLTTFDRVFWITLRRLWSAWRRPLLYVRADPVARWQRERFRRFWSRLSKRHGSRGGRPATAVGIRRLIERVVVANPLWRAPRIHGELQMLGIAISEGTVSRTLRGIPRPPTQTWKTFLHNHIGQLVSIDFFTVPTITMKLLRVHRVGTSSSPSAAYVTDHPTAAWTAQQIVEAFADRNAPRYLIRDRDGVYSNDVGQRISSMGIEEVLTAPRSPWQNPYAERLIDSIRRECLNHFVILNARHLRRALALYFGYYHGSRTHLGLAKQCPFPRQVSSSGRMIAIPQLGGLHRRGRGFVEGQGRVGIAAPVFASDGSVLGSLSSMLPAYRADETLVGRILSLTTAGALEIERSMQAGEISGAAIEPRRKMR